MEATTTHKNGMLFMLSLRKNTTESNQLICQAYGKKSAGISTIKKCFKKLRKGEIDNLREFTRN